MELSFTEFLKGSAQLGFAGILMAYALVWLNKKNMSLETKADADAAALVKKNDDERNAFQKKLDEAQQARLTALELQNKVCNEDRLEIHKQMNTDRANFDKQFTDLRANYENRIADLSARILDLYKGRQQRDVADKMEKAAEVLKVAKPQAPVAA